MANVKISELSEVTQINDTDALAVVNANATKKVTFAKIKTVLESLSNKVASWQAVPDDTHYPSEKLVKDSINAEAVVRASADAELTRINNIQNRKIENLEGQAPASTTVGYPDTTYLKGDVPSNVCKWAEIKNIKGKSVVWNQLIQNGNFVDTNGWSFYNATMTIANNICTVTSSNTGQFNLVKSLNIPNGHKYFACFEILSNVTGLMTNHKIQWDNSYQQAQLFDDDGTNYYKFSVIHTAPATSVFHITCRAGVAGEWFKVKKYMAVDLTALYGAGNEPSTTAQVLADYPELNSYCEHTAGTLKSATVDKVWSKKSDTTALDELNFDTTDYFPTGMKSAGTVYDEITPSKAIQRIGSRAYQSGDENDSTVITDKTTTYYALATPTETTITPPLDSYIQVDGGGTIGLNHTESPATESRFSVEYANKS